MCGISLYFQQFHVEIYPMLLGLQEARFK